MTALTHRHLVRIVFPLGMVGGFVLFYALALLAFGVLRLPKPGDESVANVVSLLVLIAVFYNAVYGGGRLAVGLLQWRVRARCPRCGRAELGIVFRTRTGGPYRCRACAYADPPE